METPASTLSSTRLTEAYPRRSQSQEPKINANSHPHYRGACLLTLLIVINSWENWEMCWDRIEGLMIIFLHFTEFSLNCSFIKNCMSLACLKRSVEIDMHAYIHTVHTHTHTHAHKHTHTRLFIYTYVYISGGPLSVLTCCVNARLLSAIKNISPLIYSQSWVGSWVYTTQAMMTFTLIF